MIDITAMATLCVDGFDLPKEALNFAAAARGYPHVKFVVMGALDNDEYVEAVLSSICVRAEKE